RAHARPAADHRRRRRSGVGRAPADRARRRAVDRVVRRLAEPLPEGVSMSRNLLRRPVSMLAAALVALPMLAMPTSPVLADGSQEDKIAERAELDQQLDDLRIEL